MHDVLLEFKMLCGAFAGAEMINQTPVTESVTLRCSIAG